MAQILDFQAAALARSRCDPLSDHSAPLVIVAGGGRSLDWPLDRIGAALVQATASRPVALLLHGSARGADRLIEQAARSLAWPVEVIPAEWGRYGRAAGPSPYKTRSRPGPSSSSTSSSHSQPLAPRHRGPGAHLPHRPPG